MKLAVSQIAWTIEQQAEALEILQKNGFTGLEIAPPMVAGPAPYDTIETAIKFKQKVEKEYNLTICSMQSIWYGQTGNMFEEERQALLDYSKKAILFAKSISAGNLVFGSPKNRSMPKSAKQEQAVSFFKELGDFAFANNTVFSLEANPEVYGTNFMNFTSDALEMVHAVGSQGCKLNLDFGTILINKEDIGQLKNQVQFINHVHISEPELAAIQPRAEHKELAELLKEEEYSGYVSIEMKQQPLETLKKCVEYVAEVFG